MPPTRAPDIFAFLDYRDYLRTWWDWILEEEPGMSHAAFAAATGLGRSSFHNVLHGNRRPRPETLDAIAGGIGLSPVERAYLGVLVELDRAPSLSARVEVIDRILNKGAFGQHLIVHDDTQPIDFAEYGAHWYLSAIYELARLPGFQLDPAWVAATLMPPITEEQATRALDVLQRLGLVGLDDQGRVATNFRRIQTPDEKQAEAGMRFHSEAVPELLRRLPEIHQDERYVSAAMVLLPEALLPEVKTRLAAMCKQLSDLGDDEHERQAPRRAYLLALQFLPVSATVRFSEG